MGEITINAADGITFNIEQGEFVVVVGPSGAGKTTLLNILGGMDDCDDGKIRVAGELINDYDRKRLIEYRRYDVGFVFQFYNLVQNLTALENVELATQISKKSLHAEKVLERVGLADRIHNFPSQLSGGEQQRVAIARALAKNPKLLLVITHNQAITPMANRVIAMRSGRVHKIMVNDNPTPVERIEW